MTPRKKLPLKPLPQKAKKRIMDDWKKVKAGGALDQILKSDMVITLSDPRPLWATDKRSMIASRTRVYFKAPEGFRQIGLLQKLKLKANCKDVPTKLKLVFPDKDVLNKCSLQVKADVTEYKKALSKFKNVTVK